jgi:hypothetical protein
MLPAPGFPIEIKSAFDTLRDDMLNLALKMTLYQNAYLNQDNRDTLYERTADVFRLFEQALSTDILLSIARLMDPSKTRNKLNLSLNYLFELIDEHGNASTLLEGVKKRYKNLESILPQIEVMRNKALAHRDLPTALDTPLNLPLTAKDIIQVCDEFKGIMNDIEGHFKESETLYDLQVSYQDIDNLVKHLRRGIQGIDEDNKNYMQKYMPKPSTGSTDGMPSDSTT